MTKQKGTVMATYKCPNCGREIKTIIFKPSTCSKCGWKKQTSDSDYDFVEIDSSWFGGFNFDIGDVGGGCDGGGCDGGGD